MSERTIKSFIPVEGISSKIHVIRGKKVLFNVVLADLYGIEIKRFPLDFMFQLTREEFGNLKSQFATSSWGGRRNYPYAYTRMRRLLASHKKILEKLEQTKLKQLNHGKRNRVGFKRNDEP